MAASLAHRVAFVLVSCLLASSEPLGPAGGAKGVCTSERQCLLEPVEIDLRPYTDSDNYSDSDRERVTKRWSEAFETLGVVQVTGHGVPNKLIETLRAEALKFFDKPVDHKSNFTYGPYGTEKGGYTPTGIESVAQSVKGVKAPADLVENFVFRYLEGSPYWEPPNTIGWEALPFPSGKQYISEMERLLATIHRVSADALSLPDSDYFISYYKSPNGNALRLSNYPKQEVFPEAGQYRYGAHVDYGGFTLLLQDPTDGVGMGGLEVQDPKSKRWLTVLPRKGRDGEEAYTVNVGDLWQRWTNDLWHANNHRVGNPTKSTGARLALVFFSGPRADALIEPLPGHGKSKYPPATAGDLLQEKLQRSNL
ncbi:hypothetical protein AAMO2058_001208000 [Amorphochlora amoebiformis]